MEINRGKDKHHAGTLSQLMSARWFILTDPMKKIESVFSTHTHTHLMTVLQDTKIPQV